jgi:hypothetical protein
MGPIEVRKQNESGCVGMHCGAPFSVYWIDNKFPLKLIDLNKGRATQASPID